MGKARGSAVERGEVVLLHRRTEDRLEHAQPRGQRTPIWKERAAAQSYGVASDKESQRGIADLVIDRRKRADETCNVLASVEATHIQHETLAYTVLHADGPQSFGIHHAAIPRRRCLAHYSHALLRNSQHRE